MRSCLLYVLHCYGKDTIRACVIILSLQIPRLIIISYERQNLIIFFDQRKKTTFSILQFF